MPVHARGVNVNIHMAPMAAQLFALHAMDLHVQCMCTSCAVVHPGQVHDVHCIINVQWSSTVFAPGALTAYMHRTSWMQCMYAVTTPGANTADDLACLQNAIAACSQKPKG
jgi:hypothetical protein